MLTITLASHLRAFILEDAFLHNTDHPQYYQDSFSPAERVSISIITYDDLLGNKTTLLHSPPVQHLEGLQNILSGFSGIELVINREDSSERLVSVTLRKQEKLLSKDFSLKYVSESGTEITEYLKGTLPSFDPTHCYFATTSESIIAASISLCEGISGYIQFGSEEHILYTMKKKDSTAEFFITSKYHRTNSTYSDFKSLLEKFKHHENHINKRSLVNEYKFPVPLYYEIYFVVDYNLTKEGICSSPSLCLRYIVYLLNIANSYYSEFNLHLVLQTVDIWSDHPRLHPNLTHLKAELEDGDNENVKTWFSEFLQYQFVNATEMLKSDVRIALVAPSPEGFFAVGGARFRSLCSRYSSVAVAKLPSVLNTAITLVHELGHNLGAEHLENRTQAECPEVGGIIDIEEDPCRNATVTKFYECIMIGFSDQCKVILIFLSGSIWFVWPLPR